MSFGAVRLDFGYAQARIQARCAALPAETDWRRISGVRGLGAWLEDARGGPLKDWVKGFSATSGPHDIEAGVRNLLLDEIDAVSGFVPKPWQAAIDWTQWLALLGLFEHLRAGGELPAWAPRLAPVARLLDDAQALDAERVRRAGLASLLDTASGAPPVAACWQLGWRSRWPRAARAVQADLSSLSAQLARHALAFRRSAPSRAWTLRQGLRDRLRFQFHGLALSPTAVFVYLALVALDLERLRRALLDRALFPESVPSESVRTESVSPESAAPGAKAA